MDWRHRALCRDYDPEMWFPVAESGPVYQRQLAGAKAVCARCPVVAECLAYALSAGETGIWGGLDENERRDLNRRVRTA